jgi:hypothetical protein
LVNRSGMTYGAYKPSFVNLEKHRGGDMNLSSFSFSKFCTLEEQELERIGYMKDLKNRVDLKNRALYESVPTKFDSYFSDLYFIFYKFSNFMNGQVLKDN